MMNAPSDGQTDEQGESCLLSERSGPCNKQEDDNSPANTDSVAAVVLTESISSVGDFLRTTSHDDDDASSSFALNMSEPKRLGQTSAPSREELRSINGQSVRSIAQNARAPESRRSMIMESLDICKLNLGPDSFIERTREKGLLLDAYGRVRNKCKVADTSEGVDPSRSTSNSYPEVVMVHGYSGVGKTVLVQDALKSQRGQFYLEGKFDLHHRAARPFAAISDALSDLPRQILESIGGEAIKTAIIDAIGDGSDVITSVIPSMAILFGRDTSAAATRAVSQEHHHRTSGPEDVNRQKYMFRTLFRAIGSSPDACRPLVLFLDDLQWADESSLQLIESLATDDGNGTTLIVGTYRDNEVDNEHKLVKMLRSIEDRRGGEGRVTDVFLGNLSDSEVNALVSKALRSTEDDTRSLSGTIASKTSGNPLFVTQFLLALHSDEILRFNLFTLKWHWDEEGIISKQVSLNVSDLTKARLLTLTPDERSILMIGACLGNEFDKKVLALATCSSSDKADSNLEDILQVAVINGILSLVDGVSLYAFVHDQIQYAAFCLIPEEERASAQCRAGMSIIRNASSEELVGDLLLVAVDLANCNALCFTSMEGCKAELAMLNLRAGKQAIRIAAFAIAASYFEAGIALLDEDFFTNDYQLVLDLYNLAAQAHYSNGDFGRCNRNLDMVLMRPLPIEDRLPAYLIRITVLFATNQYNKAMPLTKKVFDELGYNFFPKDVSTFAVIRDFLKTKTLFKKHKENIANLSLCEDKNRVIAMGLLNILASICYSTANPALPLVTFRILRWSIKYGLCSHSGSGLVNYGAFLCKMGDLQGGLEVGKIMAALHKRLKDEHDITIQRMYIVETFINHYTQPIQLRAKPCFDLYEESMRIGDTEHAMWALCQGSLFAWFSSMNLARLDEKIMKPHSQMIREYKTVTVWHVLLPFRQAILNLTGKSRDLLVLTGEAMDQEELLKTSLAENSLSIVNMIKSLRMELSYLFGEYELAGKLLNELLEPEICYPGFYQGIRQKFFEGLTCMALARSGEKVWMKRGLACRKMFEKLTSAGNVNTVHVLYLMNAEVASLRNKRTLAIKNYDKAISTASRNGFVQDRALAHERCAVFFLTCGDEEWASYHMSEALKSYTDWGATRKIEYLSKTYAQLLVLPSC